MTLNEFQNQPLAEAIKRMDLIKVQIHTNDVGEVQAVELKYTTKDHAQTHGYK